MCEGAVHIFKATFNEMDTNYQYTIICSTQHIEYKVCEKVSKMKSTDECILRHKHMRQSQNLRRIVLKKGRIQRMETLLSVLHKRYGEYVETHIEWKGKYKENDRKWFWTIHANKNMTKIFSKMRELTNRMYPSLVKPVFP